MERMAEEIRFPGQVLQRFTGKAPVRQITEPVHKILRKAGFCIQTQHKRRPACQEGEQERAVCFRIGNTGGTETARRFPQKKGRGHDSVSVGTDVSGAGKT